MAIVKKIEEMLESYYVSYEKKYFRQEDVYEFSFEIGKRGMIVAHDKSTNEEEDYDFFMGGFENEMGVKSDLNYYRCIDDALLDIALRIKQKIKDTHYKGIQ